MTRQILKILRAVGNGIAGLLVALVAAIGGWISYSRLFINHRLPLPLAIEAERVTFASPRAGRLSFYADRRESGAPLVLIHSINAAGSAYEMRPLFERFRGDRLVYALDLPGFGFSDRSDRPYTIRLYTDAILDFLQSRLDGAGPADVIALSLSSEFAARAALERPDLFRSLTLISPSGFSARGETNRTQRTNERGSSDRVLRVFRWPVWSQPFYDLLVSPPSIRYFLQQSFVGAVDRGLLDYDYLTTHQPGARFAPLTFVSGKLFSPDIRATVYEKLTLPILVLYDQDRFVRFDTLPDLLARPNWRAERIVPTSGLPHFEQPTRTATALDRFWRAINRE